MLVAALVALGVSYFTMTGGVQKYIYFSDPFNEMAFSALAFFVFVVCGFNIKK
jgi:hypothetical protein